MSKVKHRPYNLRISANETACPITGDVKPEGEWRTIVFMVSADAVNDPR